MSVYYMRQGWRSRVANVERVLNEMFPENLVRYIPPWVKMALVTRNISDIPRVVRHLYGKLHFPKHVIRKLYAYTDFAGNGRVPAKEDRLRRFLLRI